MGRQRNTWSRCSAGRTAALALLLAAGCMSPARGDLVGIEYWDRGVVNPEFAGGPLWTGVVDTVTNNLRIDTWIELPLHGQEFWVPRNLPLIWTARDAQGGEYDVPNTFGTTPAWDPVLEQSFTTAQIGDDFAFISPLAAHEMQWEDINGNPQTFGTLHPPVRVGWGGFAQILEVDGDYVFFTSAIGGEDDYDEQTMPRLPISENNMFASLDAIVRVTSREVTDAAIIIAAIPEASAVAGGLLVSAACGLAALLRRRWGKK